MNKVRRRRVFRMGLLLVPLMLIVIVAQIFLFAPFDHNFQRLRCFYDMEENSLDVVFIGASEVFSGYAPGYAYEEYGYTSYMYAMESNQGSLYQSQLKEILAHQNPQYIFIDVYGFLRAYDDGLYEEARLRMYTESIPMSRNKIDTIMQHPYENKISCFLPFIKYHGDPSLAKNQLLRALNTLSGYDPSTLKGMVTQTIVYDRKGDGGSHNNDVTTIAPMCREFLTELIEFCEQKELQNVVFVNFPRCVDDEENHYLLRRVEEVKNIITERGYAFLDLQKEKVAIGLDFNKDFRDSHHMNIYGQFKVTDYFGKLLTQEYEMIPMEQSEDSVSHWEACAVAAADYYSIADHAIRNGIDMYLSDQSDQWISRSTE